MQGSVALLSGQMNWIFTVLQSGPNGQWTAFVSSQ
jgi:hypothetical protein